MSEYEGILNGGGGLARLDARSLPSRVEAARRGCRRSEGSCATCLAGAARRASIGLGGRT